MNSEKNNQADECEVIREMLPAFLKGDLDGSVEKRGLVKGHLLVCDTCVEFLGLRMADLLEDDDVSPEGAIMPMPSPPVPVSEESKTGRETFSNGTELESGVSARGPAESRWRSWWQAQLERLEWLSGVSWKPALAAVAASLILFSFVRIGGLNEELRRTEQGQQALLEEKSQLERQIAAQGRREGEISRQLASAEAERVRLEEQLANLGAPRTVALSFVLGTSLLRTADPFAPPEAQVLTIAEKVDLVELQVDFEPGREYDSFRAVLWRMENEDRFEAWSQGNLLTRRVGERHSLDLSLPNAGLLPGEYSLLVAGRTGGELVNIESYRFQVTRR